MESFHRILEDECFKSNKFQSYTDEYEIVNDFIIFITSEDSIQV
ncbi:hypothetical protein [Clostridium sp. K25]|nr:hypothetical protein [Clostridium sp. K25]